MRIWILVCVSKEVREVFRKPPQTLPARSCLGACSASTPQWLEKLAERRQRGLTGKAGTPLQQIMDDLRGE